MTKQPGEYVLFQHIAKDEKVRPSGHILHAIIAGLHWILEARRWELEARFVGTARWAAPTGRETEV